MDIEVIEIEFAKKRSGIQDAKSPENKKPERSARRWNETDL